MSPLVAVVGPTGSGKSDLAIYLALRFNGEVINCDSVQVYRLFNIGTAKSDEDQRRGVPHHLIDVCEPTEVFTAGDYCRRAREAIAEIAARGRLPIVVGDTGFYLRALLHGLFKGPERDAALRERLAARRPGSLHRLLTRLDPAAAARIHPNDTNKLIRAMEVVLTAGRPLSQLHQAGRDPLVGYRILLLGLNPPRAELYQNLDARVREMFGGGLTAEVSSILGRGIPSTAKPFESLGYAQTLRLLRGEITENQAVADTQMQTRRYAKRQWTWFRREAGVEWLDGFGGDKAVGLAAEQKVQQLTEQFPGSPVWMSVS